MLSKTILKMGRVGLLARKFAPEILTATGIVGGVTAAIMGAKATLKVEAIIDETKEALEMTVTRQQTSKDDYDEKDAIKDKAYIYTTAVLRIGRLYGPTVSVAVASIGSILGAHGIMQRRNVALVAAYTAVERSFSEYRKRVVSEFGEAVDQKVYYGKRIEVAVDDNGKEQSVEVLGSENHLSDYARFFDEFSRHWQRDAETNRLFLQAQQNYANDLLRSRGHVFLNEVYDMLGLERSRVGAVVGWVINNPAGDQYIDFGLFNEDREASRAFVNHLERSVLVDFNVDGVVWNLI